MQFVEFIALLPDRCICAVLERSRMQLFEKPCSAGSRHGGEITRTMGLGTGGWCGFVFPSFTTFAYLFKIKGREKNKRGHLVDVPEGAVPMPTKVSSYMTRQVVSISREMGSREAFFKMKEQ
ncbi:MAG: hypothetical protein L3J03_09430 [Desulfobacterales bacterium]|nr:hypothetical protein [Desulfobacterales bacterium]